MIRGAFEDAAQDSLRFLGIHAGETGLLELREVIDALLDRLRAFSEGEIAAVDFTAVRVDNVTRGKSLSGKPLPAPLMALVQAGGVYQLLEKEGLIAPRAQGA